MLFEGFANYNLGVVSWMLVTNFKKTGETLEAAKYARVMTEQWGILIDTIVDPKKGKFISKAIKDVANEIPDLMTNDKYIL